MLNFFFLYHISWLQVKTHKEKNHQRKEECMSASVHNWSSSDRSIDDVKLPKSGIYWQRCVKNRTVSALFSLEWDAKIHQAFEMKVTYFPSMKVMQRDADNLKCTDRFAYFLYRIFCIFNWTILELFILIVYKFILLLFWKAGDLFERKS